MRYHFSGIAGAGMNPLARLVRARGHRVQGSDRSFDQGKSAGLAAQFAALGIEVVPQDGRGITAAVDRFVYSTAVEDETPEMKTARGLGIERVPRPALLAEVVNAGRPGVAIAGTSGKSTITGMVGWLLRESGIAATVIGGAALAHEGTTACFIPGPEGGPVAAEACESDGTLIGYRPAIGLVHNISRDHAELRELRGQFEVFARNCGTLLVNARCAEARALGRAVPSRSYCAAASDAPLDVLSAGPHRARGVLHLAGSDLTLDVPQPGAHNVENAAAAAMVGLELGLTTETIAELLSRFPGVARRFEVVGTTASGIRVVDDYAHNAEKIRAAITAAQAGAARVVAVFQPHGFGPARFLRAELASLLPAILRPADRFCYAEIFYAGGTVAKDISSAALAADLPPALRCGHARDHAAVREWVCAEARPGDTVLLMGARDPDLPRLAREIFEALR
jgi:UDP-N-acetylmuramate--alanine ligase